MMTSRRNLEGRRVSCCLQGWSVPRVADSATALPRDTSVHSYRTCFIDVVRCRVLSVITRRPIQRNCANDSSSFKPRTSSEELKRKL